MRVEIDQSGKLEDTNRLTVIALSTGKTIGIIAREKQALQKYFRQINKRRQYIYKTFAILVFLIIKSGEKLDEIVIDREYPGQEPLIKSYLLELLRSVDYPIHKRSIIFRSIGKKSMAHALAYKAFQNKRAQIHVKTKDILKFLQT